MRSKLHYAFEAHKDERAALNRQAVSSILTGRTRISSMCRGLWLNGEALDF